jgi:group I intron endonuclease
LYYTIYQIVHKPSGKIYIGKHQTKNLEDGYMGSGLRIRNAIKKHGLDQFEKKILFVFPTEEEMCAKELELVTEEFCRRKDTYNICEGGFGGGFRYIHRTGKGYKCTPEQLARLAQLGSEANKKYWKDPKWASKMLPKVSGRLKKWNETQRGKWLKENGSPWLGRQHSEDTKAKIAAARRGQNVGKRNSQFGMRWITNGTSNKKIHSTEHLPDGWRCGRIMKG